MRFWSSKPPAVASPQASRPNARSCPPSTDDDELLRLARVRGARAARRQAPGWRRADAGDRDDDLLAGGRLGAARVPPPSFRAASHTSTHRRLIPPGRPGPPHRPSRARVRGQPAAPCESGPEGAHRPPTGHEPPPTLHASGRYPDTFLTRCGPRIDTTGLRVLASSAAVRALELPPRYPEEPCRGPSRWSESSLSRTLGTHPRAPRQ